MANRHVTRLRPCPVLFPAICLGLIFSVWLWNKQQAMMSSRYHDIIVLRRQVDHNADGGRHTLRGGHDAEAWPGISSNTNSKTSQSRHTIPLKPAKQRNTYTAAKTGAFTVRLSRYGGRPIVIQSDTAAAVTGTPAGNNNLRITGSSPHSSSSRSRSSSTGAGHNSSKNDNHSTMRPTPDITKSQRASSSSNGPSIKNTAVNADAMIPGSKTAHGSAEREASAAAVTRQTQLPPSRFPKLILQTVPSKTNISCQVLANMKEWRQKNPGYKHYVFDDQDCLTFIKRFHPELLRTYQSLNKVERSDMWRYLVVYQFGGVYADSDVRCITPIARWNAENDFDAKVLLGIEDRPDLPTTDPAQILQWTLAAVPKQALFYDMARYINSYNVTPALNATQSELNALTCDRTGPVGWSKVVHRYLQARGFASHHLTRASPTSEKIGNVRVLPASFLGQTCHNQQSSYACHQFHGSWKGSEWPEQWRPRLTYNCPVPQDFMEPVDSLLALAKGQRRHWPT